MVCTSPFIALSFIPSSIHRPIQSESKSDTVFAEYFSISFRLRGSIFLSYLLQSISCLCKCIILREFEKKICLYISYSYIGKHTSLLTSAPPWKWYNVNLLFEDPLNQVREPYEILGSLEYTVEGAISNQSTFLAKGEDWKRGWFYNDDLPPKISFQNLAFPIHRRIGQFIWSAMLPAAKQQANKMQFVFCSWPSCNFLDAAT